MTSLLPDGTKQVHLSKKQFDGIHAVLKSFYQKTKCGVVMLSDESGLALAQSGRLDSNKMALLSSLAAGNYAATVQMASLVEEESGFKKQYHEGKTESIYLTGVTDSFFLVVVFSQKRTSFGMIRVMAEKLVEELGVVLASKVDEQDQNVVIGPSASEQLEDVEFRDELSSRLDSILGTSDS